jgi:hypothetical protein
MPAIPPARDALNGNGYAFYRQVLSRLRASTIPFLVGGAYALERYTGIQRHTKDLDVVVLRADAERTLGVLEAAGYRTELTFPHWLGKARQGDYFIDVIFGSGNGICAVDQDWFEHSVPAQVLNVPVRLCPVEEMIWSKAYIQERERFDGADVAHLLRACGPALDWDRLLRRFQQHWRVLLSHLVLFEFIYPGETRQIPARVRKNLLHRCQTGYLEQGAADRVCQGTLLSREQYLFDIGSWGYQDARLLPRGSMTREEVKHWTEAIDEPEVLPPRQPTNPMPEPNSR